MDTTIDFWFYSGAVCAQTTKRGVIFWSVLNGSLYNGMGFYNSKAKPYTFEITNATTTTNTAIDTIGSFSASNTQVWHHVAMVITISDSKVRFFFDGILKYTASKEFPLGNRYLSLGSPNANSDTNYWTGLIKNFRISSGIARWISNFNTNTDVYSDKYDIN